MLAGPLQAPALADPAANPKPTVNPAKAAGPKAAGPKAAGKSAKTDATRKARPKWPAALKDRVSRYARMGRVDDRSGDVREEVKAGMVRQRVDDPRGDRYERWKHELVLKAGEKPSARRYANLRRQRDPGADVIERRLARLSVTRRHADLRRHKLITGRSGLKGVETEVQELARWKRDLPRFGDPRRVERTAIADEQARAERMRSRRETILRREERRGKDRDDNESRTIPGIRERERAEMREEAQAAERAEARDLREQEKAETRGEARGEAESERAAEKRNAREEAELERQGERDEAREEKDAERDQEAGDRSSERELERQDDRALERTQQLEEDND